MSDIVSFAVFVAAIIVAWGGFFVYEWAVRRWYWEEWHDGPRFAGLVITLALGTLGILHVGYEVLQQATPIVDLPGAVLDRWPSFFYVLLAFLAVWRLWGRPSAAEQAYAGKRAYISLCLLGLPFFGLHVSLPILAPPERPAAGWADLLSTGPERLHLSAALFCAGLTLFLSWRVLRRRPGLRLQDRDPPWASILGQLFLIHVILFPLMTWAVVLTIGELADLPGEMPDLYANQDAVRFVRYATRGLVAFVLIFRVLGSLSMAAHPHRALKRIGHTIEDRFWPPAEVLDRICEIDLETAVAFRDQAALKEHLNRLPGVDVEPLGCSREGRTLYGLRAGQGDTRISVIAGCHADEPVGPMAAEALPLILAEHFPDLLERCTFGIVPQMNPDGAERNRRWFGTPPNFVDYAGRAVREKPGDDIEFGFAEDEGARPECRAAMAFLRGPGPCAAHFSLHGMACAEGAWFLLCKEWAARGNRLMDGMEGLCERLGVPQHDLDRKGEKGFTRLRPGFATTPTATAMREHFLANADPDMAARFRPSSMEFVLSLGEDPICMVSEAPLFQICKTAENPDLPVYTQVKSALAEACAEEESEAQRRALEDVARRHHIRPTPLELQVRLQTAMVILATYYVLDPSLWET